MSWLVNEIELSYNSASTKFFVHQCWYLPDNSAVFFTSIRARPSFAGREIVSAILFAQAGFILADD